MAGRPIRQALQLTDTDRELISDQLWQRRFWSRVKESDAAPHCWEWQGYCRKKGYGVVGLGRRYHQVHRLVYSILVTDVPEHLHVHHLCGNKRCVRPAHLQLITPEEHARLLPYQDSAIPVLPRTMSSTHCRQGHLLDADNLRIIARGDRICLTCRRAYRRTYYAQHVQYASPSLDK